jgi:hypothetical protein
MGFTVRSTIIRLICISESGLRPHGSAPRHLKLKDSNLYPRRCSLSFHFPLSSFVEMDSFSEKGDEKHEHLFIDFHQVDTGAQLVSVAHSPLDLTESLRIRYLRTCGVLLRLMILFEGRK